MHSSSGSLARVSRNSHISKTVLPGSWWVNRNVMNEPLSGKIKTGVKKLNKKSIIIEQVKNPRITEEQKKTQRIKKEGRKTYIGIGPFVRPHLACGTSFLITRGHPRMLMLLKTYLFNRKFTGFGREPFWLCAHTSLCWTVASAILLFVFL